MKCPAASDFAVLPARQVFARLPGRQKKDCEFYGVYIVLSRQDFVSNKPAASSNVIDSGTSSSEKAIQSNSKSVGSVIHEPSYKLSYQKLSYKPGRN